MIPVGAEMKYPLAALAVIAAAGGCAQRPAAIQATYVSSSTYANDSCEAIVAERNRIVTEVEALSGAQRKKAASDAVVTGVGVVLFWPALIGLAAGQDQAPQIASLKGNYEALTAAGHQKGCF